MLKLLLIMCPVEYILHFTIFSDLSLLQSKIGQFFQLNVVAKMQFLVVCTYMCTVFSPGGGAKNEKSKK